MIASSDDSTIAARYSGDQGGSARTASRASTCIRAPGSKTGARGDGHVRGATLEGCSDVFGEPRPAAGVRALLHRGSPLSSVLFYHLIVMCPERRNSGPNVPPGTSTISLCCATPAPPAVCQDLYATFVGSVIDRT